MFNGYPVGMATKTKPAAGHLTDLDYDLAMLGDPIADDSLEALSSISDAREAMAEITALLARMQYRLENREPAYGVREQYALDLDELADRLHIAVNGLLG